MNWDILSYPNKTTKPCLVIGTIDIILNYYIRVLIDNVLYVPSLKDSLFSIFTHIQNPECAEYSQKGTTNIVFAGHTVKADMGTSIRLTISTPHTTHLPIIYDATEPPPILTKMKHPIASHAKTRSMIKSDQQDTHNSVCL